MDENPAALVKRLRVSRHEGEACGDPGKGRETEAGAEGRGGEAEQPEGQRQVKEVGKPSSLRPVRSYQGEFRPRRHPELRKNPRNYRPRRKRVGLKPVPALEEGVSARRQRIPEWRERLSIGDLLMLQISLIGPATCD